MNLSAQSCFFVAINSNLVFISYDKIEKYAAELAQKTFETPSWREPAFPESDENIIEFLGVVNSVNFCFTDFKTHKKFDIEYPEGSGKIWSGAFAMTMCFKRALDEGIPILDPRFLMNLSEGDAEHIFRHKNTAIPMFSERIANLKSVGYVLCNNRLGFNSFSDIFRQNNFKFLEIVDVLYKKFVSYLDYSYLNRREILFNKRSQLFPMMYHGRALSSQGRLQPISDPENFGPIADYEVPKILRHFGILYYAIELAKRVDEGVVLEKNSRMETEIRAQTVNAMFALLNKINTLRLLDGLNKITMAELDYAIWNMGRSPEFKQLRHHYTYTTAY